MTKEAFIIASLVVLTPILTLILNRFFLLFGKFLVDIFMMYNYPQTMLARKVFKKRFRGDDMDFIYSSVSALFFLLIMVGIYLSTGN